MKILAIDTSSSICSTAILDDEVLIDKNEQKNEFKDIFINGKL